MPEPKDTRWYLDFFSTSVNLGQLYRNTLFLPASLAM